MITGHVDHSGRALIEIEISPSSTPQSTFALLAWIDTGFTGELVLPQSLIDQLQFAPSGSVSAVLADGSQVVLRTYSCILRWFGEERQLEVVGNDGDHALLGVGLLLDHVLHIDYTTGILSVE
ncbi:MAG: clan AA aspartic protease [Planctomycetia bacterium]|nr:clan AA aspartic protease [Planctomycetia bacterium]